MIMRGGWGARKARGAQGHGVGCTEARLQRGRAPRTVYAPEKAQHKDRRPSIHGGAALGNAPRGGGACGGAAFGGALRGGAACGGVARLVLLVRRRMVHSQEALLLTLLRRGALWCVWQAGRTMRVGLGYDIVWGSAPRPLGVRVFMVGWGVIA